MPNQVKEFNDYRAKMNDKILADNNKVIKRIFNLDTNAFKAGALDVKTKELLGLVASTVLRCDDCIKYHLEAGATTTPDRRARARRRHDALARRVPARRRHRNDGLRLAGFGRGWTRDRCNFIRFCLRRYLVRLSNFT